MARQADKKKTTKEFNQQKKRRSKGLFKKGAELHSLCKHDVALFVRDRAKNQWKLLIATDDPEWQLLSKEIVSRPIQHDVVLTVSQSSNSLPWTVMDLENILKSGQEDKPKARGNNLEDRLRSLAIPEPPKLFLTNQSKEGRRSRVRGST